MRFADRGGHDEGRPSPRELMLRNFREFPGPVAVVRNPRGGAHALGGGEKENGRPYSIHITYTTPDGQRLLVRTKAEPLPVDPNFPPPFVTVDTLQNAFGIYGRRAAASSPPPQTQISVLIDGVPVPGFRIDYPDYPDCSGAEFVWDGRIVQCVGAAAVIDVLELRSAVPEDFL